MSKSLHTIVFQLNAKASQVSDLPRSELGLLTMPLAFVRQLLNFCDVQSGRDDDRTELQKALTLAKRQNAKLIIARLACVARSSMRERNRMN
jgi:hypothetical protein